MRLTLIGLAVIAVIGAIVFFIGPLFISADDVRDKILAQIESATDYRLRVDGPVRLSVFPSLDLVAEDVGVAQASSGGAEMATAKKLKFSLALRELLGGKVKITEVTLIDPVITVPQAKANAKTDDAGDAARGPSSASLQNLGLDQLTIENGTVILPPSGGKPGKQISALMLQASLPSIADPVELDASAVLDRQKMHVTGKIASLGKFLDGTATPISLSMEAPAYLPKGLSLEGTATYAGKFFALKSMTARLGDTALAGSVSADLSGDIPAVTASLAGQTLDIDALLGKSGGTGTSGAGGGSSAGWSDAKIDFSALRSVNARLALSAQRLVYQQIKAGPVTIQATIAGGKLNMQMPTLKLYDGAGTASLAVDASGKIPAAAIRLSLANLDGYSFLKETASFESIDGTGAIALDLTTSGASQRAMVEALAGTAKLEFTDGAIRGINIAKTVRSLSTGILSGWQESGEEKTDFAALGASFKITRGQAQTADLHLQGPLVRMAGAGTVDLPGRTLKFRVDPQVVASLEGQGGKADLAGLGVPVIIAGPWGKPSIYPDIEGILQNPQAAYEQLNKLSGGLVSLKGGALGDTGSIAGGIIQNGKINKNALQQGAIMGLGALIGGQQGGAAQAPEAAAEPAQSANQAPVADQQQPVDPAPAQPKAKQGQAKEKQGTVSGDAVSTVKKGKKKQQAAASSQQKAQQDPALAPEAAARQLMQNFLGN
jgi:AsmA protein